MPDANDTSADPPVRLSLPLEFQQEVFHDLRDEDALLVLARGLGLRKIICNLLKLYDGPQSLILLVNATQDEEVAIGELLGVMGCRKPGLRIVDFQTGAKDRCVPVSTTNASVLSYSLQAGTVQEGWPYLGNIAHSRRRHAAVRYSDRAHYWSSRPPRGTVRECLYYFAFLLNLM